MPSWTQFILLSLQCIVGMLYCQQKYLLAKWLCLSHLRMQTTYRWLTRFWCTVIVHSKFHRAQAIMKFEWILINILTETWWPRQTRLIITNPGLPVKSLRRFLLASCLTFGLDLWLPGWQFVSFLVSAATREAQETEEGWGSLWSEAR